MHERHPGTSLITGSDNDQAQCVSYGPAEIIFTTESGSKEDNSDTRLSAQSAQERRRERRGKEQITWGGRFELGNE